jgi:hypothetical protein
MRFREARTATRRRAFGALREAPLRPRRRPCTPPPPFPSSGACPHPTSMPLRANATGAAGATPHQPAPHAWAPSHLYVSKTSPPTLHSHLHILLDQRHGRRGRQPVLLPNQRVQVRVGGSVAELRSVDALARHLGRQGSLRVEWGGAGRRLGGARKWSVGIASGGSVAIGRAAMCA